jgi:hypothetical protein
MAYPSIAVTSGELLFASAGGYAIFNFYKTRDRSYPSGDVYTFIARIGYYECLNRSQAS